MVDLIVPAGVQHITAGSAMAPKYRLFRMDANATLVCDVDIVIRAERAEFGPGCLIDARGAPGAAGGDGARGRNVTIDAGLAKVGDLKILADGGAGGAGLPGVKGASPNFFGNNGGPGGDGGKGGNGGPAGEIKLSWTRLAAGLPKTQGTPPSGHTYSGSGGPAGAGGPGGAGGGIAASGRAGVNGLPGASHLADVRWRANLADLLWAQRQDMGPAPRWAHALAYDPARTRTVLFGGLTSRLVAGAATAVPEADTWEWDGRLWTQVADTGPAPRSGAAMAYDPVRGSLLLFGGRLAGGSLAGDTWAWDGELWLQIEDSGPPARADHAMATDPARQRVVLFGGVVARGQQAVEAGDTWAWDGASWIQVDDTGPSARSGARMAYSDKTQALLLFGGSADSDTWMWSGQWTQVADSGPDGRVGHALSPFDGAVVLFGGRKQSAAGAAAPALLQDTWAWGDPGWRQIQDMGPSPREGHGLAYDEANGALVLFGGDTAKATGERDTWEFRQP